MTSVSGARGLPQWIESFVQWTDGTQSPLIFRTWAAAITIAGALERKVWLRAGKRIMYPNLYALLVGPPGVGKTDALRGTLDMWRSVPELHVAPSSVSRASLIDSLVEAERSILRPTELNPYVKFNSLSVGATEFGTFITAYDGEFMSTLNDLWDCVPYKEKKRHMKDSIELPSPQLNLIAGTTPAWLGKNLPDHAWSEGFASRLCLVFSADRVLLNDFFEERDSDENLSNLLHIDLAHISSLYGQFQLATDVSELFNRWYQLSCPPIPDHPKLEHYLPRRPVHLLKLAMVFSASRSDELVIRMEDYQLAMDLFLLTEERMPDVFRSMKIGDVDWYNETYNFVAKLYAREGKPVAEHRIIHFIGEKAPHYAVTNILKHCIEAGYLKVADISGPGGRPAYAPNSRH
jgi:hypothetical protein